MPAPGSDASQIPAAKRVSRWGLYLPFGLLVGACAAWSLFWVVSAQITERTVDAWVAREAALGRTWTCPNRTVGGYPFNIALACAQPSFQGTLAAESGLGLVQGSIQGSVQAARALAQVYQPNVVLIELDGPLVITAADGNLRTDASWSHLRASLHGTPGGLTRVSFLVDDPTLKTQQNGLSFAGQAGHLEVHVRRDPARPEADKAYDLAFNVRGAVVPALNAFVPSNTGLTMTGQAILTQGNFTGAGPWQDRLEAWRAAGGTLDIAGLTATQGPSSFDAKGVLALDPQHRVQGNITAQVAGLGPVMAQFGIPAGVAAIDNLLSGLLGQKKRGGDQAPKDQMELALRLDNGRVTMGPLQLPFVLQPLY